MPAPSTSLARHVSDVFGQYVETVPAYLNDHPVARSAITFYVTVAPQQTVRLATRLQQLKQRLEDDPTCTHTLVQATLVGPQTASLLLFSKASVAPHRPPATGHSAVSLNVSDYKTTRIFAGATPHGNTIGHRAARHTGGFTMADLEKMITAWEAYIVTPQGREVLRHSDATTLDYELELDRDEANLKVYMNAPAHNRIDVYHVYYTSDLAVDDVTESLDNDQCPQCNWEASADYRENPIS